MAVVLFSGGLDSSVALAWANEQYYNTIALTINYNQRNYAELGAAENIAKALRVKHTVVTETVLPHLTSSDLLRSTDTCELTNVYVEGRNMLFLTLASIYAGSLGDSVIVTGISQRGFSGFRDCTSDFLKCFEKCTEYGMSNRITLNNPLLNKEKWEVWKLADELGFLKYFRHATVTCHDNYTGELGCQTCATCKARNKSYQYYINLKEGGAL